MDWRQKLPDRRDLWILALLFLLPVIAFLALFLSDKTLYHMDLTSIHYPLVAFKARLLSSGQPALWNPHILFGFPQLAGQDVLALHPLNLIFLLPLKPHLALSYFVVAHLVLAGILSYVLARSLQISRVGALIAAVTFALSGYLMAQVTNLPILTGSVWLPLILFLFIRSLQTMKLTYAVLCSGAIALQVLASHPQPVFCSLFTLGSYGTFRLVRLWRSSEITVQEKRRKMIVILSLMAVAILAGLSLAAVQIAPTLEMKASSARATGLDYVLFTSYSLPPYNLLTFLFPNILGNPVIGYIGEETFEELHAYVGILPLLLIPWAWSTKKRDSHVAFFAILAGGSLLLALGRYTPVYHLLVHVPGFNFFRAPARWLFIATFSLSVLAGYGFDALAAGDSRVESPRFAFFWRTLTWLNLGFSLVLLACLAFGQQAIQRLDSLRAGLLSEQALYRTLTLARGLTRLPLVQPANDLSTALSLLNPALLFVLFSNLGFLLIYLWNRRRIGATTFQVMLVSLIVVDLLLAGGTTINPVRESSYYEREREATTFLQQNSGLYRIFPFAYRDDVDSLWDNLPTAYGLYSVRGHISELVPERYKRFLDILGKNAALLDLAGVKYALVEKGSAYPGYVRAYAGSDFDIYENESVLPRAFVVHDAEVIPSEEAVLERLLRDDFDPGRTVILEEEPILSLDQAAPPGTGPHTLQEADSESFISPVQVYQPLVARNWPTPPGTVDRHEAEITSYAPHRVVVEADLKADGFLVLSDTYYPGWRVFVDGREDQIYRADYLFRAVFLKRGQHTVEFRYSPLSFRLGLVISLATGAILCGILVYSSLLHRRRRG